MTQEPTSEDLMARVADGDAEALGELYARFAPPLLGMLRRILPAGDVAEDMLDKIFLRLWRGADRFPRGNASVAGWLFITARSAAAAARREERKLPALPLMLPGSVEGADSWLPGPSAVRQLEARRDLLKKVLNQLPKSQRVALDLAVFEGHTEEEIAARLGEPLGKVKSSLRAGMRFLRHRLRAVTGTWAANI